MIDGRRGLCKSVAVIVAKASSNVEHPDRHLPVGYS